MGIETVTSKDGTTIGFDRLGQGPAVVLVSGGSVDRSSNAPVAELLSTGLTVLNYDRRGRGPSGDTPPYAVEREVEDLAAVIEAAGGSAGVYGTSSGAALALEAAAAGLPVTKLALWEPPYIRDPAARPPADQVDTYERMLAEGRRDDAAEYFMSKVVRMPDDFVAFAKTQPFWEPTVALAHTLPYDARIMGDYEPPVDRAATVTVPTLILTGGASMPFMTETAGILAAAMPDARTEVLEGQSHDVAPDVIAPKLAAFFAG
jgi:pimeloyl-ACP methyl ester carboxylesterase